MPKRVSVRDSPKAGTEPYCDLNLNGLTVKEAIAATKKYVKEHNLGRVKVNFRLRDAHPLAPALLGRTVPGLLQGRNALYD